MVDEQTTATTETTETTETPTTQASEGSDTSTTETVDLSKTGEDETPEAEKTSETEETDEQKAEREERETLFGAPAEGETYALEGLPEGTVIDEEALNEITPIARELGLSNKGLSKFAGVYAEKILPRVAEQVSSNIEQQVTAKRTEWEGEAKDAIAGKIELLNGAGEKIDFGGQPLKSVMATSAKALDKYAPAGFREWLDETGLSVNPNMIAFTYQFGKLIAEDREVETAETGSKRDTPASVIRKSGGMDPSKFFGR